MLAIKFRNFHTVSKLECDSTIMWNFSHIWKNFVKTSWCVVSQNFCEKICWSGWIYGFSSVFFHNCHCQNKRKEIWFFIFIWLIGFFSFQHDLLVDLYVKIGLDVILKKFKITRDSVTHIWLLNNRFSWIKRAFQ